MSKYAIGFISFIDVLKYYHIVLNYFSQIVHINLFKGFC